MKKKNIYNIIHRSIFWLFFWSKKKSKLNDRKVLKHTKYYISRDTHYTNIPCWAKHVFDLIKSSCTSAILMKSTVTHYSNVEYVHMEFLIQCKWLHAILLSLMHIFFLTCCFCSLFCFGLQLTELDSVYYFTDRLPIHSDTVPVQVAIICYFISRFAVGSSPKSFDFWYLFPCSVAWHQSAKNSSSKNEIR